MGLAEHQAIYALHRNTNIWHIHVAVNPVNPDTETLVTVNKGFDCVFRSHPGTDSGGTWAPIPK